MEDACACLTATVPLGLCHLGLLSKFDSICFLGDPGDPPQCFLLITIKGQLVSHPLAREGASRTNCRSRVTAASPSAVIVVVRRLRVTVILHHREAHPVATSPCRSCAYPLRHLSPSVGQVPVDRQVRIVLELELLRVLPSAYLVVALRRVHLSSCELLRLQPFLVTTSTRRLTSLALSNSVLLFFELSAIHVLRCVGGPRRMTNIECC